MPIPNTPGTIPAVNTMIGLSNGRYIREYFSLHTLDTATINPLSNITPLFGVDFFGPYVLNFVGLTGPYLNDDREFDEEAFECRDIIIDTFIKFARYEAHIFIDLDAVPVGTLPADIDDTETKLVDLVGGLGDYGVTYHGQLDGSAVQTLITDTTLAFYQWIADNG